MISKKLFLVYFKYNVKRSDKPAIISPTLEDAKNYCRSMKKSSRDYEIIPVDMVIGMPRNPTMQNNQKQHKMIPLLGIELQLLTEQLLLK